MGLRAWMESVPSALRRLAAKPSCGMETECHTSSNWPSFSGIFDDVRLLDDLFSFTYEELRRLASVVRRSDPSATLSPTRLVNEAWLKLPESPHLARASRVHFKRIAAREMRQVLIEAARRRQADNGEGAAFVTFDEMVHALAACAEDLLALDDALRDLAKVQPRQATVESVLRRAGRRRNG